MPLIGYRAGTGGSYAGEGAGITGSANCLVAADASCGNIIYSYGNAIAGGGTGHSINCRSCNATVISCCCQA